MPLLLSGCLQVNIDIGIDEWHRSYLSYGIVLDVSGIDEAYHETLADAMHRLGWHYQEQLGFTVGVNTNSDEYSLTMRKTEAGGSFSEAFESLKNMLTDENISIFSQVDMSVESFERRESFVVDAVLDMEHMLRLSGSEDLPQDIQAALADGIAASGGTITLTLPVSEPEEHSHSLERQYRTASMSVPLVFDGQTGFQFRGSVVYDEDGVQTGTSDEIIEGLSGMMLTLLIASGCSLAVLLIVVLVRVMRVYKHNHLFD